MIQNLWNVVALSTSRSGARVASGPLIMPVSVSAENRPAVAWASTAKINTITIMPPAGLWPAS